MISALTIVYVHVFIARLNYGVTNILFIRGIDLFKMSKVKKLDYSKNLIKENLTAYFFPYHPVGEKIISYMQIAS